MIDLVRTCGLELESQAGRSVGYRQALEYLKTAWGFPHQSQDASKEEEHIYAAQVRDQGASHSITYNHSDNIVIVGATR